MVYPWCSLCSNRAEHCLQASAHKRSWKYRLDIQLGGRAGRRVRDLFERASDAHAAETELKAQFQRGQYLPPQVATDVTLDAVCDRYYEEHCLIHNHKPETATKSKLEQIKRELGKKPIRALGRQDLKDFQTKLRKQGLSPSTVNRLFNVVRAVLYKAMEWELIPKNPCELISRLQEEEPLPRFLSQDEINQLRRTPFKMEALSQEDRERFLDYSTVILHTGARPSSIADCSWDNGDVDLNTQTIWFTTYKGRRKHRYAVPIDDVLLELLMRRATLTGKKGPVFNTGWDIGILSRRVVEASGLNNGRAENQHFTIYGLKHCYASHLLMSGATLFDVAKLLGHTDMKMVTKYYGHLTQDHLRKVQARINLTPPLQEAI